jgi:hypothetical protein
MRHRRSVTFTKRDVLQQIRHRIPFAPAKINVWQLPRFVSKKQQKRRDSIWHRRGFSSQYLKSIYGLTSDFQHAGEFGCIARRNFEEKNRLAGRNVIVDPFLLLFRLVLLCVATINSIRNNANSAFSRFANKLTRRVVKFYPFYGSDAFSSLNTADNFRVRSSL